MTTIEQKQHHFSAMYLTLDLRSGFKVSYYHIIIIAHMFYELCVANLRGSELCIAHPKLV